MIDTEPLWRESQMEIFTHVGIHLSLEDVISTTGIRIDEIVYRRFDEQAWDEKAIMTRDDLTQAIVGRMAELITARGAEMEMKGLRSALAFCKTRKVKMAIASSSPMQLIEAAVKALQLEGRFDALCSAEKEAYGKPHPAVYLSAARALNADPAKCVAFEDSLTGTIAAKAAKMKCISVPEAGTSSQTLARFAFADAVLASLEELDEGLWEEVLSA